MTPALFSVSYAGYWGQHRLGVIPFLEKAAALGYPAVEIGGKRPHLSPLDYADEIRSLLSLSDELDTKVRMSLVLRELLERGELDAAIVQVFSHEVRSADIALAVV